jgi:4-hydroxy-tetrahydrodipicolinate reductase
MGKSLVRCLSNNAVPGLKLTGAVDMSTVPGQGLDIGTLAGAAPMNVKLTSNLPALVEEADVLIDFSFHTGIKERAELIAKSNKRMVIGTTGVSPDGQRAIAVIAERIPIMFSPNMSLGINLLAALVEDAAAKLKDQGYDIEVTEMHHRRKLDAPSGTALFLGEAAARGSGLKLPQVAKHGRSGISNSERSRNEIGMHALRGGDVVGDHTVLFAADGEMLEFSHRATSRDTFAIGALRAAAWLSDKSAGLYSMRDVLGIDG